MYQDSEGEKFEENNCFEDPTWSPEKVDHEYEGIKDEDDSEKIHNNPRYKQIHRFAVECDSFFLQRLVQWNP